MQLQANSVEVERKNGGYKVFIYDLDAKQEIEFSAKSVFVNEISLTIESRCFINYKVMNIEISNENVWIERRPPEWDDDNDDSNGLDDLFS